MNQPDLSNVEFREDGLAWCRPVQGLVIHPVKGGATPIFPVHVHGTAPLVFNLTLAEAALTGADAVRLDLVNLSPVSCLAGVTLYCGPNEPSPTNGSYFSGALEPLAAGISCSVLFPVEGMGREGAPGAWADAKELEMTFALPKGSDFTGELSIALEGVHCLARRLPAGPRLRKSGLARVLCQVTGSGDDGKGGQHLQPGSFAVHHGPWIDPPLPAPLEESNHLLSGMIMGRQTGFPPEWTGGRGCSHQWLHLLHRHHFLRSLVREFARTHDPALAKAAARVIEDWIRKNPVPLGSGGGAGAAWETLSAAWRLREWLTVIAIMWPCRPFDDKTRSLILRSVWEHARHLMDHRGHATNWAMVEAAALALAGLELPAFRESPLWARTGLERLARQADRQFLADGVHFELSPLYQAVCLEALLAVRRAALARGVAFPPGMEKILKRGLDYLRALQRPDGTWPALNDSWGVDQDYRALLAQAEHELGGRGRPRSEPNLGRGDAPHWPGGLFPNGGVCVLGDSPANPRGNRLVFRAGPAGAAHAHDDTLSLDVSLAGRAFVVDPGISGYDPDRLVEHYRSTGAHCMPWVEGWDRCASRLSWSERIARTHGDLIYAREGRLEAATAVAWGPWSEPQAACLIFRSVVSVMGDYFIVRDHFTGQGTRRIRIGWQFAPGPVKLDPGGRTASLLGPEGVVGRLTMLCADPPPGLDGARYGLHPSEGGVAAAGKDVPAAYLASHLRGELPMTLVWLMRPGTAETISPNLRQGSGPGAVHLSIGLPGGGRDELDLGAPGLAQKARGHLRLGLLTLARHVPGHRTMRLSLAG
jgi:hypothetical protein